MCFMKRRREGKLPKSTEEILIDIWVTVVVGIYYSFIVGLEE